MMPKSRKKEKFQFLKQILEDSASDKENDGKIFKTEASTKSDGSAETELEKKEKDSAGPVGKYPVLFKKTCRNKSCQTRLSSFPLFPLPEESEWISDEEGEKKKKSTTLKKKRKQNKSVSKEANKDHVVQQDDETNHRLSKLKNSDGTRKNFRSEHQLKETDNPILQAWLHKKAIVARKQRKLERKEKQAKRAALEEEARIQAERAIESNDKVGDWLKRKHKEARMAWRKSRTKVSPQQEDFTSHRDGFSPPPPPEYRVVRSFKYRKPSSGHVRDNGLEDGSNFVNGAIPMTNPLKTSPDTKVDSNTSENTANHVKRRPKTAVDRTENVSPSHSKTAIKRPKTSTERSLKNPAAQTTTSAPDRDSTKKMQSLSYDQWLRVKRDVDKERMIQKKRDLIDSHLQAVIKELGKKRVEKIMSPRKQVDTGLKNVSRSPDPAQSDTSKAKRSNPYRWVLSKKPRPEPQGCDCPESHGTDRTTSVSCHQHTKNSGEPKDANVVVQSSEKPKIHICEEVDEKYNELKPSIEKVKDILDSEIKKLKESGKGLGTNVDKPSQQTVHVDSSALPLTAASDCSVKEPKLSRPTSARPMSARPPSARPATAQPSTARSGSAYLTKDQAKKIASDLDVLGLCDSDPEQEEEISTEACVDVKHDAKSTVRENYFDYGSDVDPPTMQSVQSVK